MIDQCQIDSYKPVINAWRGSKSKTTLIDNDDQHKQEDEQTKQESFIHRQHSQWKAMKHRAVNKS